MASESISNDSAVSAKQTGTCETHGDYQQNVICILGREMRSPCPVCAAERQTKEDEEARLKGEWEARRNLESKLQASMVPKRFLDRTFDSYRADSREQRKALSTCLDYAEQFNAAFDSGRCLILSGKPGTGKTHLAAAIANYLNEKTRHTAVYRTVPGMLMYIKASYDSRDYSEADAIRSMVTPSLLVLDEIGATKPSEFELSMLFNVINGRYEEALPTVIISNLSVLELGPAMGERTLDRLREGGGIALSFDWGSARKEVKA